MRKGIYDICNITPTQARSFIQGHHWSPSVQSYSTVLAFLLFEPTFLNNIDSRKLMELSQVAKARNKGKGDTRIRSTFEHNCSAMSFCQITLKLWELRQGSFNLSLGTTSLSKEERVFQHASCIGTKICLWSSGCPQSNVPTNGATNFSTRGRWC